MVFNIETKLHYELRREWNNELSVIQKNIVELERVLKRAYR